MRRSLQATLGLLMLAAGDGAAAPASPSASPITVRPMPGPYHGVWDFCLERYRQLVKSTPPPAAIPREGFQCSLRRSPVRFAPRERGPDLARAAAHQVGLSELRLYDLPRYRGPFQRTARVVKFIAEGYDGEPFNQCAYLLVTQLRAPAPGGRDRVPTAYFVLPFHLEEKTGCAEQGYASGDLNEEEEGYLVAEELAIKDVLPGQPGLLTFRYASVAVKRDLRRRVTVEQRESRQVMCGVGPSKKPACFSFPRSSRRIERACSKPACTAAARTTLDWSVRARFGDRSLELEAERGTVPGGIVGRHLIVFP